MALLIMAIYTVLCEKLYTISRQKELRRQEITNICFKIFKIMRFLRSLKCPKTTVKLRFTKQKASSCISWTASSVFDWKYSF